MCYNLFPLQLQVVSLFKFWNRDLIEFELTEFISIAVPRQIVNVNPIVGIRVSSTLLLLCLVWYLCYIGKIFLHLIACLYLLKQHLISCILLYSLLLCQMDIGFLTCWKIIISHKTQVRISLCLKVVISWNSWLYLVHILDVLIP